MKLRSSVRAVLSAFFGVKRGASVSEEEKLPLWLVIATAIGLVAVLIVGLIVIVNLVV